MATGRGHGEMRWRRGGGEKGERGGYGEAGGGEGETGRGKGWLVDAV